METLSARMASDATKIKEYTYKEDPTLPLARVEATLEETEVPILVYCLPNMDAVKWLLDSAN